MIVIPRVLIPGIVIQLVKLLLPLRMALARLLSNPHTRHQKLFERRFHLDFQERTSY